MYYIIWVNIYKLHKTFDWLLYIHINDCYILKWNIWFFIKRDFYFKSIIDLIYMFRVFFTNCNNLHKMLHVCVICTISDASGEFFRQFIYLPTGLKRWEKFLPKLCPISPVLHSLSPPGKRDRACRCMKDKSSGNKWYIRHRITYGTVQRRSITCGNPYPVHRIRRPGVGYPG